MKRLGLILMLITTLPVYAAPVPTSVSKPLTPGTYTNEEEVYFEKEAGRIPPPWIGLRVSRDGNRSMIASVNAYGQATEDSFEILASTANMITAKFGKDSKTSLRLARDVTCWAAVPKAHKKADGSEDWYFISGLKMHDQGGRVRFGGEASGATEVILRMRNIVWASGPNRPSIILYVHTPDAPERALSYVWGDPDVGRLGVNLRWMQASCTISKGEKS